MTYEGISRRRLIAAGGAFAAAAQAQQRPPMWKPKVGILVNYSDGNLLFAQQEGFTSIGFWAQPGGNLAPGAVTDASIAKMKENIRQSGVYCSVLGVTANHIDPDPAKRKAVNDHTAGVIEIAGKLAFRTSGPCPGKTL